jgi:hypothetical protein
MPFSTVIPFGITSEPRATGRPQPILPGLLSLCASMIDSLEWKSSIQSDGGEGLAKRKGVIARWGLKEAWSKAAARWTRTGSRGLPGRTSEQRIAKSTAIKDRGVKSGGRAVKAIDLTSGDLRRISGLETERSVRIEDRGAGVSRGHIRRSALRRRPERWQDARTWRPQIGHAAENPVVWPLG